MKNMLIVSLLLALFNGVAGFASTPCDHETVDAITLDEVTAAQQAWAGHIISISDANLAGGGEAALAAANDAAAELYAYKTGHAVLFKPTKAVQHPFRPTATGALSYFVGGDLVTGGFSEDDGFALGPGGTGWKEVQFENHLVELNGDHAVAMGEYFFTSTADDSVSQVEYTFGYQKIDGEVLIYVHHSSAPYTGSRRI